MIKGIVYFFAAVLALSLILPVSLKHTIGDFDVYYNSSHLYLNSQPFYLPHGGIEEFKYSPLFALLFSPLTMMSRISALYAWTVLNIFFLFGIFYLLYKLKLISFDNTKDLLIIILLFALTGRYLFADFKIGQVNVLLCFLMVWTMYLEVNKKYFGAAVVLALSLMIKFFPLLFVLYYLLQRRFKLLAYTFLMIVVFLFLPSLYSGFDQNLRYLHDWFVLLKSTPPILLYSPKNSSLLSYFSWNFIATHEVCYVFDYINIHKGLTHEVYYAWGMSCLMFFGLFFYDVLFSKGRDPKFLYLDYSCLFVCGLLFNPLAYLNALTFLIVPYFLILRYLFYTKFNKKVIWTVSLLTVLGFILTIIDNSAFFKNIWQFYVFMELKPLMWTIILVYLSLAVLKSSLRSKPFWS